MICGDVGKTGRSATILPYRYFTSIEISKFSELDRIVLLTFFGREDASEGAAV